MCQICKQDSSWSWTDTHGVAQCHVCGTPHRIIHYENDKRIDKEPEIAVRDECVPFVQKYWEAKKSRIPGGHSFPGGYELTTDEEQERFADWWETNAEPFLVSST